MICRLCLMNLHSENSVKLFNVFGSNGDAELLNIIHKYLHLDITWNDKISNIICQNCCKRLMEFDKYCAYIKEQQIMLSQRIPVVIDHTDAENIDTKSNIVPVQVHVKNEPLVDVAIAAEEDVLTMEAQLKCEPEEADFTEMSVMSITASSDSAYKDWSMSDQKKLLNILAFKQRQDSINIVDCFSMSNGFLDLLQRRRSVLMRKLILLRKRHLKLMKISQDLQMEVRSCWAKERTQTFWEVDCAVNDDAFFKNNFRMSRSSFNELLQILRPMEKQDTVLRKAIPLPKRVAIALYALGSSTEYRTIGNMFGVGKPTVCSILLDFCSNAWKYLRPMYMANFPLTREKITDLVQGFKVLGFPQCMGAIDGCHIEIHPSPQDATDYYNYKGWYSTVLLALVDARYRFIYISVGSPGRCNDSQIYETSTLQQQLEECPFLSEMTERIGEVDVPIFIMGDSAFRLSRTLMKPYAFNVMQSENEKTFNYNLSKCRRVVENAFGHLKARFRRVGKGVDNSVKNTNAIIKACCVLHNFLNNKNDSINEKWMQALRDLEKNLNHPQQELRESSNESSAASIRNALATYLSSLEDIDVDDVDGVGDSNGDGGGNGDDAALDSAEFSESGPTALTDSDIEML